MENSSQEIRRSIVLTNSLIKSIQFLLSLGTERGYLKDVGVEGLVKMTPLGTKSFKRKIPQR
jgi:hypothetical protein